MAPPLIQLQGIRLTFGGTPLLEGADLAVMPEDRLCLVGRNGSGKSTLLKIVAGMVEADSGRRFVQPTATVRYLAQEPDLSGYETTEAYVAEGLGPGDDPHRARYLLETLGMTGDEDPRPLSGGELRRAALARAFAPDPDILLLDEPTNHLDVTAIEALEDMLRRMRSALVIISHDRRFLENLSTATVWLDRGGTRRLEAGFARFESWRDELLEQEEREQHKLDKRIAQEEDWLRYGVTARRKRNQGRLARLRALRAERNQARENRPQGDVAPTVRDAGASGKRVIEAEAISKSFGDRRILRDFDVEIARGDRVGIVGPNGAGKTTLINLLTGDMEPDSGTVTLGTKLEMATLDQRRESLDPEASVSDTLTGGRGDTVMIGGEPRHVIGYMKDFLFRPEQAGTPVKALSGGERGRLLLARALARPSNLLVLDEPTNDLDLETLDLLQEMLADYPGTLLLVSHDRDFMDRIVTSIVAWEGEGRWVEYAGGYSDMLKQRRSNHRGEWPGEAQKTARSSGKPKAAGSDRSLPEGTRRKLSFKEKHALETLPGRIEKLQAEIAELERRLSHADYFARDPAGFAETSKLLDQANAELAAAEDEWLRLELLREEIEGS